MQFFEFIFLSRQWSADQKVLEQSFHRITSERQKLWLMLFPEGTIISDQTVEMNLKYAKKAGIQDEVGHALFTGYLLQYLYK
jgi:1-acyl-sn-glycerol-3-phosphate acyltransferase